ncbi:hypothetical protein L1887_26412 [Cichorium endivia]|nr:hypothetical protein L1887_26412 [Cichorium endivia]
MASDEEDFVFFGTPIEREEDITSRKKKSIAEASGQLRTLAPWKQEVRDEEGRRRFHGAFSGGFSAGYFNTVGSKEGWTPQTFTSSRKNRAEIKQQDLSNFLDDDEKAELEGNSLGTSMQFDTFGFTAAEMARKQVEKEQNERPSAIPGPAPDEIVVPATDPIGVRLMLKMGWRRGHSIKSSKTSSLYDARREARKAFLALSDDAKPPIVGPAHAELEDDMASASDLPSDGVSQFQKTTPVYVLNPKQDMHGLGYDPFKGAPEFRENKRSHLPGNKESGHKRQPPKKDGLFSFKSRNIAPGFGIGALEELDAEDEDVYASNYDFEAFVEEIEEPTKLAIEDKKKPSVKQHGILPGFKPATNSDYQLERFDPPVVPKDFVPHHKFPTTLEVNHKMTELPPKDIPPPEDNSLKVLIEGVATLVARCGTLFEELSREKNQSNPLFDFLNGGNGHDYYKRKLWEARQKHGDKFTPLLKEKVTQNTQKLTAESRGNILGEKPLERSLAKDVPVPVPVTVTETVNLQFHLSDTFTEPSSFVEPTEITKPFQYDVAKQERFEQYMKEKYHGGLRTKDAGGSSKMSESARARERLEFEAAAEAITQGKWGKESQPSGQQILGVPGGRGLQFTSGGLEKMEVSRGEETTKKSMFPKREEFQWRPASILCKRFDLIDPYLGKPPPPPRSRSKLDSLIFMPDYVKASTKEEKTISNNANLAGSQLDEKEGTSIEDNVEVENVERPVDLYKAIFSDDSDDEEETSNNPPEDPTKKIEAANTTLSRLVAGDFLESLGKELGLEVPPENHVKPQPTQKSTVPEIPQVSQELHQPINSNSQKDTTRIQENSSRNDASELNHEKRDTKVKRNGSSSEDERSRKRSKRHRNRNRSSSDGNGSDLSDDYRDRHSSRHKDRKKESSRDRSSHGKHRKHKNRESSSKSRRYEDNDYGDGKREKRKWRD